MELYELTVHELNEKLEKKEITSIDIIENYLKRIEEKEKDVQAFVTIGEKLIEKAKQNPKAIPIGIKDNICTKEIKTT